MMRTRFSKTTLITRGGVPGAWLPTVGISLVAIAAALVAAEQRAGGAERLMAGVGKVDITDYDAGPVHDPLHARALLLKSGPRTLAIVSIEAVAIGEIGPIGNDFLPSVRARLEQEIGLPPDRLIVNASHCHGVVCDDVAERTVQAVKQAASNTAPVCAGVGVGFEDRVSENRRIRLANGGTADVRRAYSLPPGDETESVGPIDPQIGILRLDRTDGRTMAVVYNFACHPILGVPGGGNTADLTGIASRVMEQNLGEGTVALFLQGCAGDINPIFYKSVDQPRDAETLGNTLALSALKAVRGVTCRPDDRLVVHREVLALPLADHAKRIAVLEREQQRLVESLRGTSLNLESFLPLVVKYRLAGDFPSYHAYGYVHESEEVRGALESLDARNRRDLDAYVANIHTMEELTRVKTNLALLKKHQSRRLASGKKTVDAEMVAARIGDLVATSGSR